MGNSKKRMDVGSNVPVYVVDGARTPFLKARSGMGPFSASDLAVQAGRTLLLRQSFQPTDLDEVVIGSVMPRETEANIGRIIGLRLGCGDETPGWTVQRNCGSGMQALDSARKDIQLGRADLVLAGGTEAMSHAPLVFSARMVQWLAALRSAKTVAARGRVLLQWRPAYFAPVIALLKGLSDPLVGLNMGQTAEILAYQFGLTREALDAFALDSHQRVAAGYDAQNFSEVVPVYTNDGRALTTDDGFRRDSSLAALAKLPPIFDPKYGLVTAGNSSQVTDGAALLLLASEKAVNRWSLPVLGKIVDVEWAALSPEVMGLGPTMASVPLLQRQGLVREDVDYWEVNEAFSAQVLACLSAWNDASFCKKHFGLGEAFGSIDPTRLNVDGGAIALGHPVGASGARIVLHLLHVLQRQQAKRGVAAICIGGGQGGAMLVERV